MAKTILLVDDDVHTLRLLTALLEKASYAIFTATNGLEAEQMLGQKHIDLIITDEMMPKMPGNEFVAHLRERHDDLRSLPVMVLSKRPRRHYKYETLDIKYYASKPIDTQKLLLKIKETLEKADQEEASKEKAGRQGAADEPKQDEEGGVKLSGTDEEVGEKTGEKTEQTESDAAEASQSEKTEKSKGREEERNDDELVLDTEKRPTFKKRAVTVSEDRLKKNQEMSEEGITDEHSSRKFIVKKSESKEDQKNERQDQEKDDHLVPQMAAPRSTVWGAAGEEGLQDGSLEQRAKSSNREQTIEEKVGEGKLVLMAGETKKVLHGLKAYLEGIGYETRVYLSTDEAMNASQKVKPTMIVCEFCEQTRIFDTLRFYTICKENEKLRSIPFVTFCYESIPFEEQEVIPMDRVIHFAEFDLSDLKPKMGSFFKKMDPRLEGDFPEVQDDYEEDVED